MSITLFMRFRSRSAQSAYDGVRNVISKTDPRGKVTSYAYDNENRLASETDPLSHVRTYGYDAAGRLISRQDAKSQTTAYTYNDRDELTNITYPNLSYVSFAYNDAGARTQMVDSTGTTAYSYDNLFRLTGVTFPGARAVSYGYDDASRRTSITYPGGSNQVAYAYDAANRLSTVTDWNSNQTAYAYDDANRMTTTTLPNGVVSTSSYDNANRLTGITHVKGATTLASVSYTVDAVGNRSDRTDAAGTQTYAYDNLYRLTSVTYPGPTTTAYGYDAFGNRTSMTVGSATTNYSYDDASRLTTVTPPSPASAISYTWDNNGDLSARGSDSFGWDYEDRMTSATVGGTSYSYSYRGDGLRNSATTGGVTKTFTWDINAGLPVVLDDGAQYVYGNGLSSQVAGANTYYYLSDGLGSTLATTDSSGAVVNAYTYDVYGKTTTSSGSQANDIQFAGQQTDPTGLQYLRARYYDPETGGFLSRDPLSAMPGWSGGPFGYADGNPSSKTDPTGRASTPGWSGSGAKCLLCWTIVDPADYGLTARPGSWLEGLVLMGGAPIIFQTCHFVGEKKDCSFEQHGQAFTAADLEQFAANYAAEVGNALRVLDAIRRTGKTPWGQGGRDFQNDARDGEQLPTVDSNGNPISYKEWDVNQPGPGPRDAQRVVTGSDGSEWFTDDHYQSFTKIE